MRTIMWIALTGFVSLSGVAQPYTGDTWASAKAKGEGSIALAYVETPGFVYKDNSGKLTGVCLDIMDDFVKYVSSKHGVKLNTKLTGDGSSFRGMYDNVKAAKGGVFGLGNVTITEERKKEIKFSDPFITNFAILITQSSVPTLANIEDISKTFAGMTAYTAKGTLNEARILELKRHYPDLKIVNVSNSPETLEKVVSDPKGFAYLDLAFYLDGVKRKLGIKRHPIGDRSSEQFGFIMPLNSDWQGIFNEFLAADGGYTNSTSYRNILTKHLGETGVKLIQSASK